MLVLENMEWILVKKIIYNTFTEHAGTIIFTRKDVGVEYKDKD